MTQISTAYDALITRIVAVLPSHSRLTNPYRIDQNIEPFLKQGFGVALGRGVNTERFVGCKLSIERQFNITLTRKFYAKELDATSKATTEKQLFEDQFLLIKDFETSPTLNDTVMLTKFASDSGILFVRQLEDQFMYLESIITVEYLEVLNA